MKTLSLTRIILLALTLSLGSTWWAHAVVYPSTGPAGAYAGWAFGTYFQNLVNNPCPVGQVVRAFGTGTLDYGMPKCISGAWVTGGQTNYVARWLSPTTLGTGSLFDDGTSIGIGTSTPWAKLDISSTNAFALTLQNTNASSSAGDTYQLIKSQNGDAAYLYQRNGGLAGFTASNGFSVDIYGWANSVGVFKNSGDVALGWTITNATTYTGSKLFINGTSWNVGIGTTTPSQKLEVNGDALINGMIVGRWWGNSQSNIAIWTGTLVNNTSGFSNLAVGHAALSNNTTGYYNTANWVSALSANTSGYYNTANGTVVLANNTTGYYNTANGGLSMIFNTIWNSNVASWYYSLFSNSIGSDNVAIGTNSMNNNTIWSNNTAIWNGSLLRNTTGMRNTGLGNGAGAYVTTGSDNIIIGYLATVPWTTSSYQLSIGNLIYGNGMTGGGAGNIGIWQSNPTAKLEVAGQVKITGGTPWVGKVLTSDASGLASWQAGGGGTQICPGTGINNTCYGTGSMALNSTGSDNTAYGAYSFYKNTVGRANTSNWSYSLFNNTGGLFNSAYGYSSLFNNTTWGFNTANGSYALSSNIDGAYNTANGTYALYSNLGNSNTAIWHQALFNNYYWSNNVAVWPYSLYSNTSGFINVALGNNALYNNTTWNSNVAMGQGSLWNSSIWNRNTAIWIYSLRLSTTWNINTAIGYSAGNNITTGDNNTIIGNNAGLYIFTWSNNIAIGNNGGGSPAAQSDSLYIGGWIYGISGDIGIGTSTPTAKLEVAGQVKITGGTPWIGKVLTSDASGLASWQTPSGGGWVTGGQTSYMTRWLSPTTLGTGSIVDNGAGWLSLPIVDSTVSALWGFTMETTDAFGPVRLKLQNRNGVNGALFEQWGTYNLVDFVFKWLSDQRNIRYEARGGWNNYAGTPEFQFGNAGNPAFTVSDTAIAIRVWSPGVGKVLTSDANGLASWQTPSGGGGAQVCPGTGSNNTCYGLNALFSNTTGSDNTAVGRSALANNTSWSSNTAFWQASLQNNTTGLNNSAFWGALYNNTTGTQNVGMGAGALQNNISGGSNVALWVVSLLDNQTGGNNTAVGAAALNSNTSGYFNTSIWYGSLYRASTASNNVAIGPYALGNFSWVTWDNNVAVGYNSLIGNTSWTSNTAIWDNSNVWAWSLTNATAIGAGAIVSASNSLVLWNNANVGIGTSAPSQKLEVAGNILATAYLYSSDRRLKDDIMPISGAADILEKLQGVRFAWKADGRADIGFIAQDVERVLPELVHTDRAGMKSVEYANIIPVLVEGYKSEKSRADALEARLEKLESRLQSLEDRISN